MTDQDTQVKSLYDEITTNFSSSPVRVDYENGGENAHVTGVMDNKTRTVADRDFLTVARDTDEGLRVVFVPVEDVNAIEMREPDE